jgi:heme/copper-type cytochrome/quinol oxidase subunit 2
MDITMSRPKASFRQPLAALGKLTAAALVGLAALFVYVQAVLIGRFEPIVTGIGLIPLISAGVVVVGWRWAPALGAVLSGLLLALIAVMGAGDILYPLMHPNSFNEFVLMLLLLPLLIIGLAGGIGATVQNYRGAERRAPRWLSPALLVLGGLLAGAILVAAAPQPGTGVSPDVLAGLQAVTIDKFDKGEIHVKAAETVALRLENPTGAGHAFAVDALNLDAPMPAGKSSMALFKATKPGTYTFYCSIPGHYNKATGEGMAGKLIVEP